MDRLVEVDHVGHVAVVTLHRPERLNAMNAEMDRQFWSALEDAYADPGTRAVLWRADGRAFSAGRDVHRLLGVREPGQTHYQYIRTGHERTHALLVASPLPVVVAIQGWCIGGSFERALLCDIRIAAEDARFRLPELEHGLVPDSGGTARLFQMCGHGIAADMVMTGRAVDAEEALRYGIVSRVVARDELDATALDVAQTIAEAPPLAVRLHREILGDLGTAAVARSIRQEQLAQMLVYQSEDFAEFKAARAEDRAPAYRTT